MEADQFDWRLDKQSSVPLFEQLRLRIIEASDGGELAIGTKLPPVRRLADHLGIVPNTVARAYRELETAGRVTTGGRAGTVISAGGDESSRLLAEAAATFAETARAQGATLKTALAAVKAALER
ncbi:GntR family transcriptional regulator [Arthrobacter crystallopoietes]|uniref:GntR family transcriptional regulator n=1 Tax=Crystallibacter crystallopoietes TaxID=37928 RepID=UPI0011110233|nr:GntR family transcriptional regulator [Arthrobacter crystallopoietes]